MNNRLSEQGIEIKAAKREPEQGNWFPACGGTETVFTSRTGIRLLYVWQPTTGNHAYLNVDTDIILTDEEAQAALGMQTYSNGRSC